MSFHAFSEAWLDSLRHLVQQLAAAPKPPTTQQHHQNHHSLIQKALAHYADYYHAKSHAARTDVLSLFSAQWASSLERSLHWIAGWRPTTLFHLVITESSILFESRLVNILRGVNTGDLGDLSSSQLSRVSQLQCETVREEDEISDELAKWQDGACDVLSFDGVEKGEGQDEEKLRIGRLVNVVERADDLRLRTIKGLVEILTPPQGVEFLVAAAELQFGVRGWGTNRDRRRGQI